MLRDRQETEEPLFKAERVREVRHRYIRTARRNTRAIPHLPARDRAVTADRQARGYARAGKARYTMQAVLGRELRENDK